MKAVMTLLVRDEADIIRQNILFHLERGIDHIIAMDNGSLDGTRDLLCDFVRAGVLTLIDEPQQNYAQSQWVTRMALMARDQYSADWVLSNDADEFWVPSASSLKEDLKEADADALICERYNMVFGFDAEDSSPWTERLVYRVRTPVPRPILNDLLQDPLPCPYFYLALPSKVIVRTARLKAIAQGNHNAAFDGKSRKENASIRIRHFPIRSRKQFELKVMQGGAAYARNAEAPPTWGWHWRRWFRMLSHGELERALSDALPSAARLREDIAAGIVVRDPEVATFLTRPSGP